jgi:hypothetical protein
MSREGVHLTVDQGGLTYRQILLELRQLGVKSRDLPIMTGLSSGALKHLRYSDRCDAADIRYQRLERLLRQYRSGYAR